MSLSKLRSDDLAHAQLAAANNADWCHTVCRTHGIAGRFHSDAWASSQRTPALYPDAVALDPAISAKRILSYVDSSQGCSIKDSFCGLDLTAAGFNVLFEAQWICLSPTINPKRQRSAPRWRRVSEARALTQWEIEWATDPAWVGTFVPGLLATPSVVILGGYLGDRLVAGGILNRSRSAVGVSNVFSTAGDLRDAFASCVVGASEHFPGLPVVGYEAADRLAAAKAVGFLAVGPLAVWINETDSRAS